MSAGRLFSGTLCLRSQLNRHVVNRCLSSTSVLHTFNFEQAKSHLVKLQTEPDNTVKLQLYALYKQATEGQCSSKKPAAFDFVGKAKWNAWNTLGDISKDDASTKYVTVVEGLMAKEGHKPAAQNSSNDIQATGTGKSLSFEEAQHLLSKLKEAPDNAAKLQLYALYKQAVIGACDTPKPGMTDFVGKAKWTAWKQLGDMSQEAAASQYSSTVSGLLNAEAAAAPATQTPAGTEALSQTDFQTIQLTREGNVHVLKLNRPTKKNAINKQMYHEIGEALRLIGEDEHSSVAVITGSGDFYCSGNDLSMFTAGSDPAQIAAEGKDILLRFVDAFIDFPKPLIALVNGPAVGIAVTWLGLCDTVYASDKATFHTPMVALGQSAEGASTYMFPKLMGQSRANELLLYGRKLGAGEAERWGLVTAVYHHDTFINETNARIQHISKLPKQSLRLSKCLLRDVDRIALKAANVAECELLLERWQSKECMQAIMSFFQKKEKSK